MVQHRAGEMRGHGGRDPYLNVNGGRGRGGTASNLRRVADGLMRIVGLCCANDTETSVLNRVSGVDFAYSDDGRQDAEKKEREQSGGSLHASAACESE